MQLQRLVAAEGFVSAVYVETATWNGISPQVPATSGLISVQLGIKVQRGDLLDAELERLSGTVQRIDVVHVEAGAIFCCCAQSDTVATHDIALFIAYREL